MKIKSFLFTGIVSLSLLISGCGAGQSGGADSSSNSAGSGGANSSETIKIGFYGPLTGPSANDGTNSLQGAQLAVEAINAAGGIDGKKVELIAEDDQGKPEEALKAVQKLINSDKVVAIVDGAYSSSSKTVAPKVQESKVPMVVSIATHPDITKGGDYINRVIYTGPVQGAAMAYHVIQDLEKKNVAALYVEADYGTSTFGAFKELLEKMEGKVVYERSFKFDDKDFSSILTAIKGSGAEVLYIVGYYNEAAAITKQMKEVGLDIPVLGVDGMDSPKYLELAGDAAEGAVFTTSFNKDDPREIVQDFVKRWKEQFGTDPGMVGAQGHDAALVILEALKKVGTDREKLAQEISQTQNLEGVSGNISFNTDHEVIKEVVFLQVKNGKFEYLMSK